MKNKKDWIIYGIIAIISFVIFTPWLLGHMSGDDYTIAQIGYKEFIKNFSLSDGRIFSAIIISIYEIFNINIEISTIISLVGSIIICSFSVVYLKKIIEDIKPCKTIYSEIIVTIISFVTIFNFMQIDCFSFIDSIGIELSILLVLIAVKTLIKEEKRYNIKTLLIITLACFTYQASIFTFIPLTLLFTILKYKNNDKKAIINIVKSCIFVFIGMILNIIFIKCITPIVGINNCRAGLNFDRMLTWAIYIIDNFGYVIVDNFCYYIPGLLLIIMCILFGTLTTYTLKYKKEKQLIFNFFIVEFFFFLWNEILFIITNSSLGSGRMNLCLGMMIGAGLIYIYVLTDIFEKKGAWKYLITTILAVYLVTTIYKTGEIILTVSNNRKKDIQTIHEICDYVEKYENENNIKVTKICEVLSIGKNIGRTNNNVPYGSILTGKRNASAMINYYKKDKLITMYVKENEKIKLENTYKCIGDTLYIRITEW